MFAYISVSVLMLAISAQEGSVAFFALGRKRRGMGGDYYVLIVYLFIYIFHWTVWSYIVEDNFGWTLFVDSRLEKQLSLFLNKVY